MEVPFKGGMGRVERRQFYCKAGAYTHKTRWGWVLIVDGKTVMGDRIDKGPATHGADRYEWPEYRTRKALLQDIEMENEEWRDGHEA